MPSVLPHARVDRDERQIDQEVDEDDRAGQQHCDDGDSKKPALFWCQAVGGSVHAPFPSVPLAVTQAQAADVTSWHDLLLNRRRLWVARQRGVIYFQDTVMNIRYHTWN